MKKYLRIVLITFFVAALALNFGVVGNRNHGAINLKNIIGLSSVNAETEDDTCVDGQGGCYYNAFYANKKEKL
jgi:hypothetical protein